MSVLVNGSLTKEFPMGRPGAETRQPFSAFLIFVSSRRLQCHDVTSSAIEPFLGEPGRKRWCQGFSPTICGWHLNYMWEELEKAKIRYIGYPFKSNFPVRQPIQMSNFISKTEKVERVQISKDDECIKLTVNILYRLDLEVKWNKMEDKDPQILQK
jgi:hypothetical protein